MPEPSPEPSPTRPLVIAHRGASADEPEHTLAAYRRGFAVGADGVECDVRLTADQHLVCVHDRRVDRTSNGRGVVSTLELAHLEGLDWGSWKAMDRTGDVDAPDRDRKRLLTLNALLTTVVEVDRPLVTLIETKHPSRHGGKVERAVDASLRRFGFTEPGGHGPGGHAVRVMSFSYLALHRMHDRNPRVPLVYLVERELPWIRDGALPEGVGILGVEVAMLRRSTRLIKRVKARGHQIYVWTADTAGDVRRCRELGVDAIITNRPKFVLDQIASTDYSA